MILFIDLENRFYKNRLVSIDKLILKDNFILIKVKLKYKIITFAYKKII